MMIRTLTCAMLLCVLAGCASFEGITSANPRTTVGLGPFGSYGTFYDNKDNDVEIRDVEFNAETKQFKLGLVKIINNASKVREANAVQLEEFYKMQARAWDSVDRLTNIVNALFAQINTGVTGRSAPTPDIPAVPVAP